jgi:hypothetical protein
MRVLVRLFAVVVASALAVPALAAVKTWDGGASTTSWHDGDNGSPNGVPGALDDATIPGPAGTTVVHSTGSNTVKSISCSGTLQIQGGQLTVTGAFTTDPGGTLDWQDGSMVGAPTVSGATLIIGATATSAQSFVMAGASVLQGDIHQGQTVTVRGGLSGHATLSTAGAFIVDTTGLLDFALGTISCNDGYLDIEASVSEPSALQAEGALTELVKNASTATTITVVGGLVGHSYLNMQANAYNLGIIQAESQGGT